MDFLRSDFININLIEIDDVPVYVVRPKGDFEKYKTIIFYHGWGSSAQNQIFRANILASYGYQVILPEARYHGTRGELDYEDKDVFRNRICEVIMHNIEEFPKIHKYVVENLDTDDEHIAVGGHSMGAITASGLFTFKQSLKVAMLFNGVCDWKWIVDEITASGEVSYEMMRINEFMLQMNPKEHLSNLVDREMIMYNGEEDDIISPKAQENFYKEAKEYYLEKDRIRFTKWEATAHQLTTQMLEKAIMTLKEEIKF